MVSGASIPKVSVIVPVYNSDRYLEACVASILDQDYENIEVILVDDGSTDASGEICEGFAASDDRVVVVRRANGGIAAAQNSGLDVATGELITFCDNDDLMSSRTLSRLVDVLLSSGADMSCCRWYNVGASVAASRLAEHAEDRPGRVLVFDRPDVAYQTVFSIILRKLTGSELRYFSEANWGKLYRRELFDGLRFPEGRYAQDVAIAMDLYSRMGSVASCDDHLYFWLQRADSVSHKIRSTSYYHDIVRAHGRCFDRAVERGVTPARAYFGMTAISYERRSIRSDADRELYEADRRFVAQRVESLSLRDRIYCVAMRQIRRLEVLLYNVSVHRRR